MTTLELILTLLAALVALAMILKALPTIHESRAGAAIALADLEAAKSGGVPQDEVANLAIAVAQTTAARLADPSLTDELRDRIIATVLHDADTGNLPAPTGIDARHFEGL